MRWIAGESFAAHAVHWVVTVVEEISQGDILLLPSHELNIQEVWIAQQRGAAGVILLGPQPSTTNGLAAGLPIVVLDSEENLRAVQRLLLILLINQRAGLVERGYRIHLQLAQLSAEGAGLAGLVKAMVDISGKGVLVQDKRGYVLAEQSSAVLLGIWQDVLVQLSTLNTLPELLRDRKVAGKKNSPLLQEIPGGLVRLIVPITVGEVARGYLSLVGLSIEMDELDHMVAEQGVVAATPD